MRRAEDHTGPPPPASALEQQLNDASTWDARFDLLDDAFRATARERVRCRYDVIEGKR